MTDESSTEPARPRVATPSVGVAEASRRWTIAPADLVLATFAGALVFTAAGVVVGGVPYYALPGAERPAHPLHGLLAPGAPGGVLLGVVGTALMLVMLVYSVRKALFRATWIGRLDRLLRFHIVCGVMGPVFIALHAGLKLPTGLIAVGFWSMVLVALSGVFGRYAYGQLPRLASGRELRYDEAMAELADQRAALVAVTAASQSRAIGEAVAVVSDVEFRARTVPDLIRLDREVRRRWREATGRLATACLPTDQHQAATRLLRAQLQLGRGVAASRVGHQLLRYWHLFHRPLAKAMYTIVAVHVLIALSFGGSLGRLLSLFGS